MRFSRPLLIGALLVVGAGSPVRAGVATVVAPVSLNIGLGAVLAVPALASGLRLESYPGLAAALVAPAAPALALTAPLPTLRPVALAAPASPERLPAPSLKGLASLADGLAADRAKGTPDNGARLSGFFDASKAGSAAPSISGLPQPSMPADYLPLPITTQETNYSCGAASALSVLRYWHAYDGDERSLYELLGTRPQDGTPPEGIARGLGQLGLRAGLRERMTLGDLRAALRHGDSVILDIQAWREDEDTPWSERWQDGHYVALAGMDEHYAYLMDPSTPDRYAYVPLPELLERWHDYEDRDGPPRRYYQLGIVVRGAKPLPRPATPPVSPEPIKFAPGPRSDSTSRPT